MANLPQEHLSITFHACFPFAWFIYKIHKHTLEWTFKFHNDFNVGQHVNNLSFNETLFIEQLQIYMYNVQEGPIIQACHTLLHDQRTNH